MISKQQVETMFESLLMTSHDISSKTFVTDLLNLFYSMNLIDKYMKFEGAIQLLEMSQMRAFYELAQNVSIPQDIVCSKSVPFQISMKFSLRKFQTLRRRKKNIWGGYSEILKKRGKKSQK